MPYAEVIGDPIAQSRSPLIHQYWLEQLGLAGDYRARHVPRGTLGGYFADRRSDGDWRGCNVTIPHKKDAAGLVNRLDDQARAIGALNCVVPCTQGLLGSNTDVAGIAAALDNVALEGGKAVIIGGGGAARAAIFYLGERQVAEIVVLVRDPGKRDSLGRLAPRAQVKVADVARSGRSFARSAAIINATPMGMAGAEAMPGGLLAAVRRHSAGATLFDMVYDPVLTPFLSAGEEGGGRIVVGLTMLLGQAAGPFDLFFGAVAPAVDDRLRSLLGAQQV